MTTPRKRTAPSGPLRAVGYLRVSTSGQAESGAGLDAQRAAVQDEAARRGWTLALHVDAGASGKSLTRRPALAEALDVLRRGEADVLVVSKLARLSRSVADFAGLLDTAKREGWGVVALDLGVDTTTSTGRLVANVMMSVAQWEREVIGERTREGLAAKREQGVRLGRPQTLPRDVVDRIVGERGAGRQYVTIAADLTRDGVPTARGGPRWAATSVQAVMRSQAVQLALAA